VASLPWVSAYNSNWRLSIVNGSLTCIKAFHGKGDEGDEGKYLMEVDL